ncbi:NADP-dependent malic enzyme [Candidatus Saccharibacteria bacterium]|nr:NADP-dependent malic enzyme [Candidatus Saccharibacteria bacterium]
MTQHDFKAESLAQSKKLHGNIELNTKTPIKNEHDLSVFYTPGIGAVSSFLAKHPDQASEYTIKNNTVAVVSDGSAVLGLGNIGPFGALPVMEGKSALFKELGDLDAFPICLDTQDVDEIVAAVKHIAPVFAGINLEDIAAPNCFEIEKRLQQELDIPVIHDDQHATAIVVLAGLINALKVTSRDTKSSSVVLIGAGAAGNGVAKLLLAHGFKDIVAVDSKGIVSSNRQDLDPEKKNLALITNPQNIDGDLSRAVEGRDVLIGLSGRPDLVSAELVRSMKPNPIVFALGNPNPEILPDVATGAGAAVVATGRSDFPNQINNALVFPGMFKGVIKARLKRIDDGHKLLAAQALAGVVQAPTPNMIVPSVFDKLVVPAIVASLEQKL